MISPKLTSFIYKISLLFFILFLLKVYWRKFRAISKKGILSSAAIFVLIVVMAITLFVSFPDSKTSQRIKTVINVYKKGEIERVLGRRLTYRWKMAGYMMADYPITGVGNGAFIIESTNSSTCFAEFPLVASPILIRTLVCHPFSE